MKHYLLFFTLLFLMLHSVHSQNITWIGAASEIYENPQNWDLGRKPNANDDVLVPNGSPTMQINNGAHMRSLTVEANAKVEMTGDGIFIDAMGCNACHGMSIESGGVIVIEETDIIQIKNTDLDGIHNEGILIIELEQEGIFIIDSAGGNAIYNSDSLQLINGRFILQVSNDSSIYNTNLGRLYIAPCTWVDAKNPVYDDGLIINSGSIIEHSNMPSRINQNDGFIHNFGGSSFTIATNNGFMGTNPFESFVTIDCFPESWWSPRNYSQFEVPGADENVLFTKISGQPKFRFEEHGLSKHLQFNGLFIQNGANLTLAEMSFEVDTLINAGTLVIENSVQDSRLVINEWVDNDTLVNNGIIENISGFPVGGTVSGSGVIVLDRADIRWTGAVNTDWNNISNWSPNQIPNKMDVAFIPECISCPEINSVVDTVGGIIIKGQLDIDGAGELLIDQELISFEHEIGISILENGTVNNQGTVDILNANSIGIANAGVFQSSGKLIIKNTELHALSAIAESTIELDNITILDSAFGGIVLGDSSILTLDGNIEINSTKSTGEEGVGIAVFDEATCVNNGALFYNNGFDNGNDGIRVNTFGSSFINNGDITINRAKSDGVEVDEHATLTNVLDATITVNGYTNDALEADAISKIWNYGSIHINIDTAQEPSNAIEIDESSELWNYGMIAIDSFNDDVNDAVDIEDGSYFFNAGTLSITRTIFDSALHIDDNSLIENEGNIVIDQTLAATAFFISDFSCLINGDSITVSNSGQDKWEVEEGCTVTNTGTLEVD